MPRRSTRNKEILPRVGEQTTTHMVDISQRPERITQRSTGVITHVRRKRNGDVQVTVSPQKTT